MVCPDWTDPRNVGAAFRLADAAGLSGLILGGTTPRPPHPKIAKTARSTVGSVNWITTDETTDFLRKRKEAGCQLFALEITDESHSLFDLASVGLGEGPIYLIAGNESSGVSQELLDLCDAAVHLPMYGQNTSMNVSVSLGAAVYLILKATGQPS